jgi:uncharacterized integral membrane protein (TIGR00697 family)
VKTSKSKRNKVNFAQESKGLYPYLIAIFCGLLLISNIGAVKLIEFGPIITDGGAFLFPLVYIVGDVLSEVYGFKATRKAIFTGFGLSILASLTFLLVQFSPAASDWPNQTAFETILGFVPQIVLASVSGYLVGQLLNSYVLVKIKEKTREKYLWLRLIGSTAVGELADTIVFCTIAFYGILTGIDFIKYVVIGYLYKTLLEVVLLPITYRVIKFVKAKELSY